jgi:hypothetical protein
MTAVGACHSEGANVKQVAGQRLESNNLPEDPKFEATEESSLSSRQGTCHSEGVTGSSLMVEKKNIFPYVDGNPGDRRIFGLKSALKIRSVLKRQIGGSCLWEREILRRPVVVYQVIKLRVGLLRMT